MTEPERAALDHIRQVVDSAIGVRNLPDALPAEPTTSVPDTLPPDTNTLTPDPLPPDTNTPTPDPLPPATNASILPVPYISQLGAGSDQFIGTGAATGAMLLQAYTD